MSTLIESPSPAASPRTTGYRLTSQSSPLFRPSASPIASTSRSAARAPEFSPHYSPHFRPAPYPSTRPQYADAGVQCYPEGASPAARRNTTSVGPSTVDNKEKESSQSPVMRSTKAAAGATGSPPDEPAVREDPSSKSSIAQPQQKQDLPRRPASDDEAGQTVRSGATAAAKRLRTGNATVKVMPRLYETCNPKDLGVLIANMLLELIRINDAIPLHDGKLTRFHSRAPPGISCHDYLLRLIQHATLSPPILLSMVFYIDRLCALYPAFTISSLTVHRFLITAATVAAKGLSDSFWTNPTYARIGGISTGELATLEMDFLQRVQWRIVPKPEILSDYYLSLVQRSEGYELEEESDSSDDTDKMEQDPT